MKIGDIVYLRSGSPRMTIENIKDDNTIICVWFDRKKERFEKISFNKNSLESSSEVEKRNEERYKIIFSRSNKA